LSQVLSESGEGVESRLSSLIAGFSK
jgi:hypothetical protein